MEQGTNLYELSGEMPAYRNLMIEEVNGAQNKIIVGGKEIYPGDILNDKDESTFRRVQIREEIQIKVLMLSARYRVGGMNSVAAFHLRVGESKTELPC